MGEAILRPAETVGGSQEGPTPIPDTQETVTQPEEPLPTFTLTLAKDKEQESLPHCQSESPQMLERERMGSPVRTKCGFLGRLWPSTSALISVSPLDSPALENTITVTPGHSQPPLTQLFTAKAAGSREATGQQGRFSQRCVTFPSLEVDNSPHQEDS